jgi:cytochrome P450
MTNSLPPGPRMPVWLQTLGTWSRPTAFLERSRRRYGSRFTTRLLGQPPLVMISDPAEIEEVFKAPPHVLHPGEGARILEPIVGRHSVILLDEGPHLEQRKLLLPAFHGERMQSLSALMEELTEREIESWPRGVVIELHPRLQRLTLEIILRAVFGLERGAQLDALRDLLTRILSFSESPLSLLPPLPPALSRFGPPAKLEQLGREVDELIFALIDERRRDEEAAREDVLALLLAARHEDGSPMSAEELRDELMTALVAGHETTASQLAWAFERLAHEPVALARLQREIDAEAEEDYLSATITEIMRLQPVLPNAEPRLVKEPVEIGGVTYPPGILLMANAYLVHHDPAVYPDPYAFRPERFLEREGGRAPGTYTWIPFGGGRRRCIGASFAQLEMKIVIRSLLRGCELSPAESRRERTRRRSITISPARGCRVVLAERRPHRPAAGSTVAEHAGERAVPAAV